MRGGAEATKGGEVLVATHGLLAADRHLNFVGNIEGHQLITGTCDVLVTDGFAGNVLLKFYESVGDLMIEALRDTIPSELESDRVRELVRVLDYNEYGGAPLLGVDGVSIVCHGAAPATAFKNALRTAQQAVESGMVADLAQDLAESPVHRPARRWRRGRRRRKP